MPTSTYMRWFVWFMLPPISTATICRCFPTDTCWPSSAIWSKLNDAVDGNLVITVPLGTPYHDPTHNAGICKSLQQNWLEPKQHYTSSSSIMAPFFANQSCNPFTPKARSCTLGNNVDYAINVIKPSDVIKGLAFAKQYNVRLVIRNTGHDYIGKSTGSGALAIWTHHLKSIQFLSHKSSYYTGKAIKLGADVQGFEAYEAADKNGLAVVGGKCPTVGLAGGYTQNLKYTEGGHSALASKYGLAADQTLEWEVVDGAGNLLGANRDENSDLYWALSGGGGGTYAIVMSMTVKAHPDISVSGANLTFTNDGISQDAFYKAIGTRHASLPKIVDVGAMAISYYTNTSFTISPVTAPGISKSELEGLLYPFTAALVNLGVKYTMVIRQFPGYLSEFSVMQLPIPVGVAQYGGRLIPRSVVEQNNNALTAAIRNITEDGATFVAVGLNLSKALIGEVYNAVLPAWRDTLIDALVSTRASSLLFDQPTELMLSSPWDFSAPWAEMIALQRKMTDDYIPQLTALSSDSSCYLNEI